ncbi:hypothetical protein C8F01DRAFT_1112536 [Mycena amicta]|nr:hypothetical protein C8F01DRAFT_1112536 [Mycena amicta]
MSLIGPVFLPELEREIFEITGWLHRTRIPTLLRVARRVYIWLRPVLYRVLRLSNRSLSALIPAMEREPNFLRDVVRFICWDRDNVLTTEQTRLLLTICSGVEDLVLEHSYHEPNRLGLALSRLVAEYENLRRFTSSSMEFMLVSSRQRSFPAQTFRCRRYPKLWSQGPPAEEED